MELIGLADGLPDETMGCEEPHSFLFSLGSWMDGGTIYWKGMDQSGEENLDSTRHKIKIALNERESERQFNKKQGFFPVTYRLQMRTVSVSIKTPSVSTLEQASFSSIK